MPLFPLPLSIYSLSIHAGLLTKDAGKRLGCTVGGAAEVKSHAFFRHVDWKELRAKRLPVPWQPTLRNALDTSTFDRA